MTVPASGLWGPGDYGDDFVTIETLRAIMGNSRAKVLREYRKRMAIKAAILDMAEDLAEMGMVVISEDEIEDRIQDGRDDGHARGVADGLEYR